MHRELPELPEEPVPRERWEVLVQPVPAVHQVPWDRVASQELKVFKVRRELWAALDLRDSRVQ